MVGDYFADIIADQVILEIKAAECLRKENRAQLINYLKATDKEVGLLFNFGKHQNLKECYLRMIGKKDLNQKPQIR